MKKRIFVYLFLFIIACYSCVIIGTEMGKQGYKEQQQQYNEKEKIIDGIVTNMKKTEESGDFIIEINEKEYDLDDFTACDYSDSREIYNKIEINDTIKIYESKDYINALNGYSYIRHVIKCNDKIIYNNFESYSLNEHINICIGSYIVLTIFLSIIFIAISEECFVEFFEDYSYNRKQKKKKKKEAKQEKIKELKKKLEEYEKDQNKTNYKCQYCHTKNINKAKYCHNCGLEF